MKHDSTEEKEYGVVKEWNGEYGLARSDRGDDVFFHIGDRRNIVAAVGQHEPIFADSSVDRDRYPKKGECIIFIRRINREPGKHPKANPWGFETEYKKAYQQIRQANATIYRVCEQRCWGSRGKDKPVVLIEGCNIATLCQHFPRTGDTQDPIRTTNKKMVWIEKYTSRGWESCEDPRPFVG